MDAPVPLDSALLRGLLTALLIIAFGAITAWAYSARRRSTFEALARLPLEEDSSGDDTP